MKPDLIIETLEKPLTKYVPLYEIENCVLFADLSKFTIQRIFRTEGFFSDGWHEKVVPTSEVIETMREAGYRVTYSHDAVYDCAVLKFYKK